jgi:hypothetical protein
MVLRFAQDDESGFEGREAPLRRGFFVGGQIQGLTTEDTGVHRVSQHPHPLAKFARRVGYPWALI